MIKLDIIWDITSICPWDCAICCVDARYVKKTNDAILISNAKEEQTITFSNDGKSAFEQALVHLQQQKIELTFEEKIKVIDNIDFDNVKIDFSGGDALIVPENYEVLKYASKKFGKENITLTLTGLALARTEPNDLII